MNERIWDKFLTERDKAVFAAGGFGARAGVGKRPGLLVIDVKLGALRRVAGAHPGVDQAMAYLVWRGELGGSWVH